MHLKTLLIIFILITISGVFSYGQQNVIQVKGLVKAIETEESLIGVNIRLKNSETGTVTDLDGEYSISVPANGILIFSSIGYETQEINVDGRMQIDVIMSENKQLLDDVIVIGYTTQTKQKTTASVAVLNKEELVNVVNPNPLQAMQGKLAGVSIPITSGQPGEGANNIIIRGGTKVNTYGSGTGTGGGSAISGAQNTNPLVVIDGVFRTMDDINPDNIESIQVMKDAASTAIYGARGANGVIVIKTKGGSFNSKPVITFSNRTTLESQLRGYDYLNASEYLKLARNTVQNTFDNLDKNNLLNNGGFSAGTRRYTQPGQFGININSTALYNNIVEVEGQAYVDKLISNGWETMDDPINPGTRLLFYDNKYEDLIWKNGVTQNYNASLSGGSSNANYNISAGYIDQKGTFIGTDYKRYDVLGNFGFKASDKMFINAMINYQNALPNFVDNFQNDITRATRITPLIRIFKDDGKPMPGELYSVRNRLHTLEYDDIRVQTERYVSKVGASYEILKGLSYKPSFSNFLENYSYQFFRRETPTNEIQPPTQRQKNQEFIKRSQLMIDQILQYDFDIKNLHNFTTLVGFNYTRNLNNRLAASSQRGNNDYIFTINEPITSVVNNNVVPNIGIGNSIGETRSASYYGQANYDFDGKYLATASLRYDGFSNFAPANKYALFPSLSAGWNITRETFWKFDNISLLKLRGSWGAAGLNDLSITDTYGGFGVTNYALGAGILRSNLANENLVWESTETLDLAVDVGMLKDRVQFSLGVYDKRTKDRLDTKPLPTEAPFSSIRFNNGVLQNKGVEFELAATIIKTKDFTWRTNFTFALNKTLILELPDNGRDKNRQGGGIIFDTKANKEVDAGGLAEGERPFALFGYRTLGVFATEAEAAAWNAQKVDNLASPRGIATKKHAGDFIFDDINNDGIIDTRDQVFLGWRNPDKIGGIQNYLQYKGFSVKFAMDYAMGHVISNGNLARSLGVGRAFNEGAPVQAVGPDIWQKEGDTGKKYARFSFADFDFGQRNYVRQAPLGNNNAYGSDVSALISKGDFLAFREISIGFELPSKFLSKVRVSSMNIFASVFNLGYLTKYDGVNPESYTGFDAIGYPRPRQFTLGANLRF
jgi:TonB-linked SusC/RagA family outer membrane protein